MSTQKSKQRLSDRYSSTDNNNKRGSNGVVKSKKLASLPVKITICAIALVVITLIAVSLLGSNDDGKDSDASTYNLVVTPDDIDEQLANAAEKVAPGSYDVTMNNEWHFKDAKSASKNARVDNIVTNTNTVNFIVRRNDNDAVIYESPYLPVGSSLQNIKLDDTSLEQGTYPCTLTYRLIDDEYKELSTVSISLTIIIEE